MRCNSNLFYLLLNMKTTSVRTKCKSAKAKTPRYKFDPLWRRAMSASGCDDSYTEQMVRDYIEHGKQPNFHYLDQQGFACAWIIIRADIDRRRRRNERARERRRQLRARLQAEREAAEKDARKAARLERKAASTRSSREKSKAMRAAKAARGRIAGRNQAPRVPSCLNPATAAKASRQPTRQRFADRFRGPGYKNAATAGGGLP